MNKREQMEIELKFLHNTIEEIDEAFGKSAIDENGDYVVPEQLALKIKVLLEL